MKTRLLVIVALFASFLWGCDDMLDKTNPNDIAQDNFWKTEKDAHLAIMGCYDALQAQNLYGRNMRDFEMLSDNSYNSWAYYGYREISEGNHNAESAIIENTWKACYMVIGRCNQVIANLPGADFDEDIKNEYIAEARFLRALGYLHLTMCYGEVPLILKPQEATESAIKKSTQEDIVTEIGNDLKFACEKLPLSYDNTESGRATKGAAYALKARTHLYFGQWGDAADAALEVMGMGYSLDNDYAHLFTVEGEGNVESIFAVKFETGLGEGEWFSGTYAKNPQPHHLVLPNFADDFYCNDGKSITESSVYDPTNPYKNRDPRMDVSILKDGDIWVNKVWKKKSLATGYGLKKYIRKEYGDYSDGNQDFMVFRYADVLLMRAEALIESGETGQEVYDLINQVRQRASVNMPTVEDAEGSGLNQEQLREIVRHERRVEFGLEGTRYYDLKRWGIVKERYEAVEYHDRHFTEGKDDFWPIPQRELDNNELLEQNSKW